MSPVEYFEGHSLDIATEVARRFSGFARSIKREEGIRGYVVS